MSSHTLYISITSTYKTYLKPWYDFYWPGASSNSLVQQIWASCISHTAIVNKWKSSILLNEFLLNYTCYNWPQEPSWEAFRCCSVWLWPELRHWVSTVLRAAWPGASWGRKKNCSAQTVEGEPLQHQLWSAVPRAAASIAFLSRVLRGAYKEKLDS